MTEYSPARGDKVDSGIGLLLNQLTSRGDEIDT